MICFVFEEPTRSPISVAENFEERPRPFLVRARLRLRLVGVRGRRRGVERGVVNNRLGVIGI